MSPAVSPAQVNRGHYAFAARGSSARWLCRLGSRRRTRRRRLAQRRAPVSRRRGERRRLHRPEFLAGGHARGVAIPGTSADVRHQGRAPGLRQAALSRRARPPAPARGRRPALRAARPITSGPETPSPPFQQKGDRQLREALRNCIQPIHLSEEEYHDSCQRHRRDPGDQHQSRQRSVRLRRPRSGRHQQLDAVLVHHHSTAPTCR